jgi:thiamine-monophosphate kinase
MLQITLSVMLVDKSNPKTLPNILGKEFDCINKIMNKLPVGAGIGDDCAVIDFDSKSLLVSVDSFIEDVHFDMNYFSLEELGEHCAEGSLSDIAAMGGKALYMTLALSVPKSKLIDKLSFGIKKSLKRHKVKLIGGDTTYSKKIVISCTVIGEAKSPVYRAGAKPGDEVYISSYTGLSKAGFYVLKNKIKGFKALKSKHLRPLARLDISQKLSSIASSMIDISDGLVSELYHLAHSSNVDIIINNVPIHKELKKLEASYGVSAIDNALFGGEDFELLYTIPKKTKSKGARTSFKECIPGIKIGIVKETKSKKSSKVKSSLSKASVYIQDKTGKLRLIRSKAYSHF